MKRIDRIGRERLGFGVLGVGSFFDFVEVIKEEVSNFGYGFSIN